jgi:hypothetical protein
MSDGIDKKEEFDSTGEAIGYISLDQAILQARRLARQDEDRYRNRLSWDEIAWVESSAEQREDSYRVVLQFKRPSPGPQEGKTGEEEFIFGLTGVLEERQVLLWPADAETAPLSVPAPDTARLTEDAVGLSSPDFPGHMPMTPPPIRMLLLLVGLVRKLVERVSGRKT